MTATVKTVETKTNSYGDSFVITTWTIGDHTLHQVVDSYGEANWNAKTLTKNAPDLYTLPNWDNPGVVEYGVNWPAMGTKTPTEALEYAAKLTAAAHAAEAFTEIHNDHA